MGLPAKRLFTQIDSDGRTGTSDRRESVPLCVGASIMSVIIWFGILDVRGVGRPWRLFSMVHAHVRSDYTTRSSWSQMYVEPISYVSDTRYIRTNQSALVKAPRIWGRRPQVITGRRGPKGWDERADMSSSSEVEAGLQIRLDVATADMPRFNPSILRVDPQSPLARFTYFLSLVRGGQTDSTITNHNEGDPVNGVDFANGRSYATSDAIHAATPCFTDLLLLDRRFRVLAQTRVRSAVKGLYRDCRLMYLGGKLHVYTTAHSSEETHAIGYKAGLYTTLRPLDLIVSTNQGATSVMVHAELRDMKDRASSVSLTEAVYQHSEGSRQEPLKGKNHIIFQSRDSTYIINHFAPLEIWRLASTSTVERASVVENEALSAMQDYHLNGGKLIWMPELQQFLGMIHWHQHGRTSVYTQAFFTLTPSEPFEVRNLSHEFCFDSMTRPGDCDVIQFSPNVERVEDVLILPYGRNDLEAMVMTMRVEDVLGMLRPVSSGTVVLKQSR